MSSLESVVSDSTIAKIEDHQEELTTLAETDLPAAKLAEQLLEIVEEY